MKKVVVTGGCGYIGSHTVVALMEKGYDVVSIDMLNRNQKYVQVNVRKLTAKNLFNKKVN